MEFSNAYLVLSLFLSLLGFGFGILAGYFIFFKPVKGVVVIEANEDNTRDCIRFVLDLDLEDIEKEKFLLLKVEDRTSKNSQLVK